VPWSSYLPFLGLFIRRSFVYTCTCEQVRRPIEKLALRAKGLREAISVHCLDAEKREVIANGSSSGSVLFYRLRIEDVETTQWWMILKRYRDFAALHAQLVTLWPPTIELAFPAKVMVVEIASL